MELEIYKVFKNIPNFDTDYMTSLVVAYATPIQKYLYSYSWRGKVISCIAETDAEAVKIVHEVIPTYGGNFREGFHDEITKVNFDGRYEEVVKTLKSQKDIINERLDMLKTIINHPLVRDINDVAKLNNMRDYFSHLAHYVWSKLIIFKSEKIPLHNKEEIKSRILVYVPMGLFSESDDE